MQSYGATTIQWIKKQSLDLVLCKVSSAARYLQIVRERMRVGQQQLREETCVRRRICCKIHGKIRSHPSRLLSWTQRQFVKRHLRRTQKPPISMLLRSYSIQIQLFFQEIAQASGKRHRNANSACFCCAYRCCDRARAPSPRTCRGI